MGRGNLVTLVIFAIVILLFPHIVTGSYSLRVINFAGIFCLVTIGLSLLLGYAGQISIGQAGFFAIGAYSSGILTTQFGYSAWLGILLGLGLSALLSYLVGIPTLKLRGHYLAMATLGIGEIIHITAQADTSDAVRFIQAVGEAVGLAPARLSSALQPFRAMTGGPSGFGNIPTLEFGAWSFSSATEWFYLIWGLVLMAMILSLNLIHSRIGRALRAIHGNEDAARAMGLDTSFLKLRIFIISAGLAAIAGSLYAHYVTFISPGSFSINQSIMFVVMVAVGGMTNVWGAVFGTIIMTILPESLRVFHDYDILVYGLVLLGIMMFMPQGVVGLMQGLFQHCKTKETAEK
ncbi:MAG: branched-chain amino acid ABC transporter permease [Deltaproteobacteria bacterium]|nr:branched-chain amino acid ABC transporter permease [Deltaproteobacteria bacterium]